MIEGCNHSSSADELRFLAPVYGWPAERFDTVDLKDAKALFDDLS